MKFDMHVKKLKNIKLSSYNFKIYSQKRDI